MAAGGISTGLKVGQFMASDTLGNDFHESARKGNKRKLKKILERGLHVDYPNSEGQSPLFIACLENQPSTSDILLLYGANPNERSNEGITPVHMACYSGNIKLLTDVISAGGDLRLHDNFGRSAKDWALSQADPKKRLKMIEFLEKTRLFAMTKSGRDLRIDNKTSNHTSFGARTSSIVHMIREKIKGNSHDVSLEQLKSCHSMGFGKVYLDGDSTSGFMSTLPLISDSCLKHDSESLSFENGFFMVMESMLWKNTKVTVKRLHREIELGGEVDLLINEMEQLGKIRHPNVLLLMGVCQTNNLNSLVLIFEHIGIGSLYYVLHEKFERLPSQQINEVLQQVCDALIFLHEQHLIHCFLTSHAVNITMHHVVKIGNFEYMVDSDKSEIGRKTFVTTNTHQNAAYNWMAPEIMIGQPPSAASDMYSFSVLLWEMLQSEVPWGRYDAETIRCKVVSERQQLPLPIDKVSKLHQLIMEYGLQYDPLHRELTFNHIRDLLHLSPERANHYIINHLGKDAQRSPQDRTHREETRKEKSRVKSGREDQRREDRPPRKEQYYMSKPERPRSGPQRKEVHREKDMIPPQKEKYNHNQSSTKGMDYSDLTGCNQQHYPADQINRFKDGVSFDTDGLHWDLEEEQKGDDYFYTVGVKQKYDDDKQGYLYNPNSVVAENPVKQIDNCDKSYKEVYEDDSYGKKVEPSESEETCSTQTSQDSQLETSLARPLTNRFSYLNIKPIRSPTGVSVKPASHCTDPNIEKAGEQLTTAGSVYALYNLDDEYKSTPNKDMQLHESLLATMPRKRKRMGMTPNMKKDGLSTLGGEKGSVRDLVDLFQHQADNFQLRQAVLNGNLKEFGAQEKNLYQQNTTQQQKNEAKVEKAQEENLSDYNNHGKPAAFENNYVAQTPKSTHEEEIYDTTNSSSFITVSPCEDSLVQSSSSVETELIDHWVTEEVKKVQSTLSEEIFQALSDKEKEPVKVQTKSMRKQYPQADRKERQNQNQSGRTSRNIKQIDVEEFYIDDELNQGVDKNNHTHLQNPKSSRQHRSPRPIELDTCIRKSSFVNIPHQVIDGSKQKHPQQMYSQNYPSELSDQTRPDYQKLQFDASRQGAYVSTVTVRSNMDYPDHHAVTHTVTNVERGTTDTLYTKTIKASRVVSALFAPDVPL